MTDSDVALVATPQEFGRWIHDHLARHIKVSTVECLCGWHVNDPDNTATGHEEHYTQSFFAELGAVAPSGINDPDGAGVLSWHGAVKWACTLLATSPWRTPAATSTGSRR